MPKNKNAEYRFMVLDRCFSDFRHKYTIEDLLEKEKFELLWEFRFEQADKANFCERLLENVDSKIIKKHKTIVLPAYAYYSKISEGGRERIYPNQ